MAIGPVGLWSPGIHCGYSSVNGPDATGIVSCTRNIPCTVSLASTCSEIVPGYRMSWAAGRLAASTCDEDARPARASAIARVISERGMLDSGDAAGRIRRPSYRATALPAGNAPIGVSLFGSSDALRQPRKLRLRRLAAAPA